MTDENWVNSMKPDPPTGPWSTAKLDLHGMVQELCDKQTHRERYSAKRGKTTILQDHVTVNPSLLDQLDEAVSQSAGAEEGPRPAFASKPTARLDALDTLLRIDHASAKWVRTLGHDDPGTTADCVRKVASLAVDQDTPTRKAIEADVRRWWTWARIVTGWDTPAWSPDNTCPLCGTRGSLRIRLAQRIGMCTESQCRETWDETNIGLLADHIRAECDDEGKIPLPLLNRSRTPNGDATPCQCRTCQHLDTDALVLCPACASSRCPRAADHMWPCAGPIEQAG